MNDTREVILRGATGRTRIEKFEGRDHVVVPVVALLESVIHAVNADSPEYVPLATLTAAAHSWNGRPLVLGHPERDGMQISANDPGVWESHAFGKIFNTRIDGKRLCMEAWIDPVRLDALGQSQMLKDAEAGLPIEVSVGAHVRTEASAGDYLGKPYKAIWREAAGDHLAFLPGGRGACSVAMGCGVRALAYRVTPDGLVEESEMDTPADVRYATMRTLIDQAGRTWDEVSGHVKELQAGGLDADVTGAKLDSLALLAGSMVADLFSLQTAVEQCRVSPYVGLPQTHPQYPAALRAAIGARNSATDKKRIQAAHDASHDLHEQCVDLGADCLKTLQENHSMADTKKADRIKALAENDHSPIKNVKDLEAISEEGLTALESSCECAKKKADELKAAKDKAVESEAALRAASEKKTMTEEEFYAMAPASLRSLIDRQKAQDAETRATLVEALKTAQDVYSEDELKALSIEDLQRTARLAKIAPADAAVDYSGRGVVRTAATTKNVYSEPPNPYDEALKRRREQASA